MNGTGDLQLIGKDNNELPTDVRPVLQPEPRQVTVRPGDDAGLKLHWIVVPVGDEPTTGPCQPTPVSVRVTPPEVTRTFTVPWTFGPVCWHGRLDTSAYMPIDPA
nr:lipoprotein [Kibdelosporangium sp. MJ126-NF4]